MPALAFKTCTCSGHSCFPPRANDQGSSNVFVNGKAVHRVGDHWVAHQCGTNVHDGTLSAGSSKVFCNGQAVGRIGDAISCGSVIAEGSPNVFVGA